MLRSIGDIARSEGEDLKNPETTLACLQVFALGGFKGEADAANSGYFAVRGCWPSRLVRLRASSPSVAEWLRVRRCWCG
jgi:hypothetical protein